MGTSYPADLCEGLQGEPDLRITADADSWLGFLWGEKSIFWALIRRKVRLKGPLRLLLAFGRRLAPDTGADCRFARKRG